MSIKHVLELIDVFLRGEDVSINHAWEIEDALENLEAKPKVIEETLTMLASYRPGGGEFLFDQAAMERQLQLLRRYLANESGANVRE